MLNQICKGLSRFDFLERFLADVGHGGRETLCTEPCDLEDCSGLWLLLQDLGTGVVPGSGDVHGAEVRAAPAHGGDVLRRNGHLLDNGSLLRVHAQDLLEKVHNENFAMVLRRNLCVRN